MVHSGPFSTAASPGMSDGILFLRVAADRIGAPGPDRREDGRHSKATARQADSSHTQWAERVPYRESRLKPFFSKLPHLNRTLAVIDNL